MHSLVLHQGCVQHGLSEASMPYDSVLSCTPTPVSIPAFPSAIQRIFEACQRQKARFLGPRARWICCTVSGLLPRGICFLDHLPGPLPRWLGQLTNLQRLQLDENHLHGAFPQSMNHLGDLEVHTEERMQEGKRERRERLLEDNGWT